MQNRINRKMIHNIRCYTNIFITTEIINVSIAVSFALKAVASASKRNVFKAMKEGIKAVKLQVGQLNDAILQSLQGLRYQKHRSK